MAVGIGEELGIEVFEDAEGEVGLMGSEVRLDEATGSGGVTWETLEIGLPKAGGGAGFGGGFGEGGGEVEIAVFGLLAQGFDDDAPGKWGTLSQGEQGRAQRWMGEGFAEEVDGLGAAFGLFS
jgi:hypothetical protein